MFKKMTEAQKHISDIEHVASEGMERFGKSDIEGKAAMGSGE